MNSYFYQIWIPLQIITIISIILFFLNFVEINWLIVFFVFFLIGPVGTGVGFHKLFSHRQFETSKFFEYILAILGTLNAYAPLLFWASQHIYHHKNSDKHTDPSSPKQYGFWESFLLWRLRKKTLKKISLKNYPITKIYNDKFLMFLSKKFTILIYIYALFLYAIDFFWLINLFVLPSALEHFRINIISSLSHANIPFNYRNFETKDNSHNNIIIGYLSFGFGWHNNHHNNSRELINTHKWWEIDVEGLIAKCISKNVIKS